MKNKLLLVLSIAIASLITLSIFFFKDIEAYYLYKKMWLNRKDDTKSKEIAEKLSSTREGVDICAKHLDIFGGRMFGLCEYVLHNAEKKEYVKQKLSEIRKSNVSKSNKIAVNIVYWQMFHEKAAVIDLFILVQKGSNSNLPIAIESGRNELADIFENANISYEIFLVPPKEDINLTLEEFENIYDDTFGNNVIH